uniref:Uncharacterized protein n=1 Tax=viral metagenome TaxID=1070528 RepID=A0A6C0D4W3_9ZZZZ
MNFLPSYLNQIVLNDEEAEETGIVKGGYPMTNIIEFENLSNQMLGGAKKVGGSRFAELVIPLSLDTHYRGGSEEFAIKTGKKKIPEIIDENRFNRIFDSIILTKKRRENTRKNNDKKHDIQTTRKSKEKEK